MMRPVVFGIDRPAQSLLRLCALTLLLALAPPPARAQNVELVGQIGGGATALAVQDRHAFLGQGPNLLVLDVIKPAEPAFVATIPLPDVVERVVAAGRLVFAASRTALFAIDVSRPDYPHLLGVYNDLDAVGGLAVYGDTVYVGDKTRLLALDARDPARMTPRGEFQTDSLVFAGLQVAGSLLYAATDGGLLILDVSRPARPTCKCLFEGSEDVWTSEATDVRVAGRWAYVSAAAGLLVVDVANPSEPLLAGACLGLGRCRGLSLAGPTLCAVDEDWGVFVIDVAQPDEPVLRAVHRHGIWPVTAQCGRLLYGADPFFGLRILDLANPEKPRPAGAYATDCPQQIRLERGLGYVANGARGLELFDFRVAERPERRGRIAAEGPAFCQGVTLAEGRVYATDVFDGLQVISDANPDHPSLLGSCGTPGHPFRVAVRDRVAYVADGFAGLSILNAADPRSMRLTGRLATQGIARDVALGGVRGTMASLVSSLHNDWGEMTGGRLDQIDVSRPFSPRFRSFFYGMRGLAALCLEDRFALLAGGPDVYQVELSATAKPALVNRWELDDRFELRDVVTRDGLIYAADLFNGLLVFDARSPGQSCLVAAYNLPTAIASSVAVDSQGTVYLATERCGIYTLRVRPRQPVAVSGISRPGYAVSQLHRAGANPVYSDEARLFAPAVPLEFQDMTYLLTRNADRNLAGDGFLSFEIDRPAKVYVGVPRAAAAPLPEWLGEWDDAPDFWMGMAAPSTAAGAGADQSAAAEPLGFMVRHFPAGRVTLGANRPEGTRVDLPSMYTVVVVPE